MEVIQWYKNQRSYTVAPSGRLYYHGTLRQDFRPFENFTFTWYIVSKSPKNPDYIDYNEPCYLLTESQYILHGSLNKK